MLHPVTMASRDGIAPPSDQPAGATQTVTAALRPVTAVAPAVAPAPGAVAAPVDARAGRRAATPADTPVEADTTLNAVGLLTVLVGIFLPMMDFFIVNVALPTIDRDLHASAGMLQLVVAGYAITYALFLVVGGRLGDAVGRRRLFMIGMAAFTLMSLLCGIAPTIELLVAFRALQGAAAAVMVPQVLSTIQAATTGHARAKALGKVGAAGGIASVAGQVLGGLLVAADIGGTGWRPIFLVNVPVGLAGLLLATRTVPESRSPEPAPVDAAGTALLGATVLALLIPLTEGRSLGWPTWTIVMLAASPLLAVAFAATEIRSERRGGIPLVPFSLLRVPSMRWGLGMGVPFFAGFSAFMFVYALTLQDDAHFSPLKTGLMLAPMGIAFLVASLSMARLVARFGRRVITAGTILQGIGLVGIILSFVASWPTVSPLALTPGMVVAGFGQGLVMSPLFRVVLSQVPPASAGVGSGVLTTTQQTSLALGVSTLGSLYLTEIAPSHLGGEGSLLLVLAIMVAIDVVIAGMSRKLPD